MALIKCPECGKEISDKATNCPHCGVPMRATQSVPTAPPADAIRCPSCHSTNVHIANQGFSTGKAVAGFLTIGAIGTLAGNIGRDNIKVTCLNCGRTFNPVEEKKKQQQNEAVSELMEKSPAFGCLSFIMVGLSVGLLFVSEVPFWVSAVLFIGAFITMVSVMASK